LRCGRLKRGALERRVSSARAHPGRRTDRGAPTPCRLASPEHPSPSARRPERDLWRAGAAPRTFSPRAHGVARPLSERCLAHAWIVRVSRVPFAEVAELSVETSSPGTGFGLTHVFRC
jgi:hypothetical protein